MHHRHSRFTLRVPPNVSSCSTTASTLLLNDMGSLHFVASGQPWKLCVTANFDRFVNILQRSMMDRSSDFVAGIVAGAASNFLLHPLDVIKVRYQVADGSAGKVRYRSTVNAVKTILANEGVRGLFKGAVPGVTGASASWGFYFFFYERAKSRHFLTSDGPLASHHHTLAALEAGMLTVCITNPLWLIKTRMQLQSQNHASNYRGMVHAFTTVVKQEGFLGLYKGIVPALALTSHGAVQFTAYERMKSWCAHSGIAMDSRHYLVMGALSKTVAAMATYPFQVVKSRLQQRQGLTPNSTVYTSVSDCVSKIVRNEGPRGFFKGATVNLYKTVPASSITLVIYEFLRKHLSSP